MNAISNLAAPPSITHLISELEAAKSRLADAAAAVRVAQSDVGRLSVQVAAALGLPTATSVSRRARRLGRPRGGLREQMRQIAVGNAILLDGPRHALTVTASYLRAEGLKFRCRTDGGGKIRVERLA